MTLPALLKPKAPISPFTSSVFLWDFHLALSAATRVWNKQTADTLIEVVIAEYQIIEQSAQFGIKPERPSEITDSWRSFLSDIKVSYDAAKGYISGGALFDLLVSVAQFSDITDAKVFLELLQAESAVLLSFFKEQRNIFKQIADIWMHGLTDEQIGEIYLRIGEGHFAKDKSIYKKTIESEIDTYRSTIGSVKLRNYWKEKTGTETPQKWSDKYLTPILCLVPSSEIVDAKKYFGVINSQNPKNDEAESALLYLETITWWADLASKEKRDAAFESSIIGEYAIILTVDKVKEVLNNHFTDRAYYWYSNDQARAKVKELAQAVYDTKAVGEAVGIISKISDAKIKEYLIRLIKGNMAVGIEIIADNKGE